MGCNGGPGTPNLEANQDELGHLVARWAEAMRLRHVKEIGGDESTVHEQVVGLMEQYWQPGRYERRNVDRSRASWTSRSRPQLARAV